jgi:hypothetical protein
MARWHSSLSKKARRSLLRSLGCSEVSRDKDGNLYLVLWPEGYSISLKALLDIARKQLSQKSESA